MPLPHKDKLTRPEAAEFLGVSVFTLNQWASEGKGPRSIRVGRQCVYHLADLQAFKATREGQGLSATPAPITAPTAAPAGRYLMRLPEVIRKTGMSRSSIYAKSKNGEFVAPCRLGPRSVAWDSVSVERWIAERIEATSKEVA